MDDAVSKTDPPDGGVALAAERDTPRWEFIALLTLLSLLVTGYKKPFIVDAMTGVAALVARWPGMFPGDPFATAFASFPSTLWPLLGWFSGAVPLAISTFLLFVASRGLLVYSLSELGRVLGGSTVAGTLAAIGALAPMPLLGGGGFAGNGFTHSSLAMPMLVLAMAWTLDRHYLRAAALLSVTCFVQLLAVLYALPYLILSCSRCAPPVPRGRLFMAGLTVLASAFIASLHFGSPFDAGPEAVHRAAEILRLYNPWHTDPAFYGWGRHVIVLGLLALGMGLGWVYSVKRGRVCGDAWAGRPCHLLGASLIASAFYLAAWLPSAHLTLLQPMRGMDFWYPILIAGTLGWLHGRSARATKIASLVVVALCGSLIWTRFWPVLLLVPVAWWVIRSFRVDRAPWLACLLAILFLEAGAQAYRRVRDAGNVRALLFDSTRQHDVAGWGPLGNDAPASQAVADWAREHTLPDATFAVPPSWSYFRIQSRRPVHALLFDLHAGYLTPGTSVLWLERMADYHIDALSHRWMPGEADQAYRDMGDVAREKLEGIDYWVLPVDTGSRMWTVITVGDYHIVRPTP